MKNSKFVLIGGGSYAWTRTLFTDIALNPDLKGLHVVLQDINTEALHTVTDLCKKVNETVGGSVTVEGTSDLDRALTDADFVGLTISTGGASADAQDMHIPQKHGVIQTVADTVGPGGWIRSLRNIPVVIDIIRKVERKCPDAWFMNYTNPMTVLTKVINKVSSIKCVGICHELQGLLLHLAYYFGLDWQKDFSLSIAGINHLIWVTQMAVKGHDGLRVTADYARDPENFKKLGPLGISEELLDGGGAAPSQKVKFDLLSLTGYLPAAGDAHIVEFIPRYLCSSEEAAKWGFGTKEKAHTFARTDPREKRKQKCLDMLSGKTPIPVLHSHEHADRTIAALSGSGAPLITPVNLPNVGQIDNIAREAVVETLGLVTENFIHPLTAGKLPDVVLPYVIPHVCNQEMIAEAGLTGNRELALQALVNDPAIRHPDIAVKIAEDFFSAYKDMLPQFNGQWSL